MATQSQNHTHLLLSRLQRVSQGLDFGTKKSWGKVLQAAVAASEAVAEEAGKVIFHTQAIITAGIIMVGEEGGKMVRAGAQGSTFHRLPQQNHSEHIGKRMEGSTEGAAAVVAAAADGVVAGRRRLAATTVRTVFLLRKTGVASMRTPLQGLLSALRHTSTPNTTNTSTTNTTNINDRMEILGPKM